MFVLPKWSSWGNGSVSHFFHFSKPKNCRMRSIASCVCLNAWLEFITKSWSRRKYFMNSFTWYT